LKLEVIIKNNVYYDSVSLMQISKTVESHEDIEKAMVGMGTAMNKELLENAGLINQAALNAQPSDLIIAYTTTSDKLTPEEISSLVDAQLNKQDSNATSTSVQAPKTIPNAIKRYPEINFAQISVSGTYAAQEARKALNNGLHVMLFSDNVSVEDEIELKSLAHAKGLLMMGPDCGTAIINSVGLGFSNEITPGDIGIIGASGTGTQETSVLIDKYGGGCSQVLGTGGRDLSKEVGGSMMLDCLAALAKDEKTKIITLISKPPVEEIADKIIEASRNVEKQVVICFINDRQRENLNTITFTSTLEDAARLSVQLSTGKVKELANELSSKEILENAALLPSQKYVRGLYCGGTLCDESASIFHNAMPETTFSNVGKVNRLQTIGVSQGNTFLDMGDDTFTVGKPHPMIEPSLRNERFLKEALDPETAVVLFDVELGYGSHKDPAGEVIPAIVEAQTKLQALGRHVVMIAYVLGTEKDKQIYSVQVAELKNLGVIVANSNAQAAKCALDIIRNK
jgi:succinyl-CoA synthetase alpha subunit